MAKRKLTQKEMETLEDLLEDFKADQENEIECLKEEHQQEIDDLREEHREALKDLKSEHRDQLNVEKRDLIEGILAGEVS